MNAHLSMQQHNAAKCELSRLLRNLAGFALGFLLAAWVCFANAGYAWNGACHDTPAEALQAFKLDMSTGDSQGFASHTQEPVLTSSNAREMLISWSMKYTSLMDAGLNNLSTGSTRLYSCTPDSVSVLAIQDVMLTIALVFSLAIGWRMGQAA